MRPARNIPIDLSASRARKDAIEGVVARDDVAVIALSGRGEAFCAGVNLRAPGAGTQGSVFTAHIWQSRWYATKPVRFTDGER